MKKHIFTAAAIASVILSSLLGCAGTYGPVETEISGDEYEIQDWYRNALSNPTFSMDTPVKITVTSTNPRLSFLSGFLCDFKNITLDLSACTEITEIVSSEIFHLKDSVTDITLPDSIIKISDYGFSRFSKLESLTLPPNLKEIGNLAFSDSALTSLTFPDSLQSVGIYFIDDTNISEITLPSCMTELSSSHFRSCPKLKKIILNKELKNINHCAFEGTGLEVLDASALSSTELFGSDFINCNTIKEIILAKDANRVINSDNVLYNEGCGHFFLTGLATKKIVFNEEYSFLKEGFLQGPTVEEVEFTKDVGHFMSGVFRNCTNLKSVKFTNKTPPEYGAGKGDIESIFARCPANVTVYIPSGSKAAYEAAVTSVDEDKTTKITFVEYEE